MDHFNPEGQAPEIDSPQLDFFRRGKELNDAILAAETPSPVSAEQRLTRRLLAFSLSSVAVALVGFTGMATCTTPKEFPSAQSRSPLDDTMPSPDLSHAVSVSSAPPASLSSEPTFVDSLEGAVKAAGALEKVGTALMQELSPPSILPAAPAAEPVPQVTLDHREALALLDHVSAMTKLRKSTVMIKVDGQVFSGVMIASNTLLTAKLPVVDTRHAPASATLSGIYGGEQKPGKMITYFPKPDLSYRLIQDPQRDLLLIIFDTPIFKGRNVYPVSEYGFHPGEAVATAGHPMSTPGAEPLMDTLQAGLVDEHFNFQAIPGSRGIEEGYIGSPLVNTQGKLVGLVTRGAQGRAVLHPLTKEQVTQLRKSP